MQFEPPYEEEQCVGCLDLFPIEDVLWVVDDSNAKQPYCRTCKEKLDANRKQT